MPSLAWRWLCAIFFARRTIDKWGPLIFESPLFISPPFFFLRSVPVCNEEEDAGFTGKRLNSKMVVFSGSKTSYLPRMMTLYEQCIRVLQNNIDCEQHSLWFTKDDPVGGARVPPTGSAPQHSQEVIKMQTWRTQFSTLTQKSRLCF